ncbi:hypothetical protein SAMN02745687_02390 [Lachnospiraceae bacterium NK3A20]|nr:hypothetical protein SAMN02745687_02390 [Lachnospiraceae bacterium NK3A20]
MLDIEILKTDYAVSYGSVTLKSLQNDNVPELDLLVREGIQNSSDASLKESGPSYSVNFLSGKFEPSRFNSYLTDLEDILNDRYSEKEADFLEIRDTKTSGLTGVTRKSEIKKDDHGNFFKLIFDTGKRQTISNAGGNWGFGKSVYYRVGIGIVIFYSRIKTSESEYENRLIITLVEDESKTDQNGEDITLLNSIQPLSAGKAWWGLKDGDDLLPVSDDELIASILDVFGIKPFREKETGTSIIIPYIKTEELLNGIIPVEAEIEESAKEHFMEVYASSISSYLRLAIQKWYAPKIHNRELQKFCNNKWLLVTVDNVPISKTDMLPFFRLVQELYTTALAKTYNNDDVKNEFDNIVTLPVNIRSYFQDGQTSGYVAMIKITDAELRGDDIALSPYDYIGKFEADGGLNEPIVMFARDPGMIIDYEITGDWVKNVPPPESTDEFLFAFYVPQTDKVIKKDLGVPEYAGETLGAYLRECEASDHMAWTDPVKMQIVQRIQKNTVNAINNQIKKSSIVNVDATASKLSTRLGKDLLPRIGYGKQKVSGGSGGGGGNGTRITNIGFQITSQTIRGNIVEMDFVLKLMHGKKQAEVSMMIASEGGWIDAKSWEEDIGTEFPVTIQECYIDNVKTAVSDYPYEIKRNCDADNLKIETEELFITLASESGRGILTQLIFIPNVLSPEIKGKIRLRAYDKKYQFTFRVE